MRRAARRGRIDLGPPPWIGGHRGGEPWLENTIPALLAAVEAGADFVELDVQRTRDGELVVFHDSDLGRLAGLPGRSVETSTAAELAELELRDPRRGEAGRIARLAEVFAALPRGFPVNVEIKRERADVGELVAALAPHLERANLLVSSFDHALLHRLRARDSQLALAPLGERLDRALLDAGAALAAWSVHVAAAAIEPAQVATCAPPVLAYTVDDADAARRLFAAGVAGVFSDRPGALRAALAAKRGS